MRPRKTVSAEASPHDKRARSASQEYVTPEDRASQKRKQPDMTPKKVRKLPRPQVHHSEELAWPEKHPEPQKQSREARIVEGSKSQDFFEFVEGSKSQDFFFEFVEGSESQDFFDFFEESLPEGQAATSVPRLRAPQDQMF